MRPNNEMDFLADFLVLRMMASICTSCKCDISSFVYLCNKRDRERAASRPWPTSRGPLSRAHFSSITAGSKKKRKKKKKRLAGGPEEGAGG